MQEKSTIARPYARAAFEQAHATGALGPWSDMLGFLAAVVSDARMRKLISHPRMDTARLSQFLVEICGTRMAPGGGNFIHLLADAGRLAVTPEIHNLFEQRRARAEDMSDVEIVSAFELDEGQRARLGDLMTKRLKRKVRVSTRVDSAIIGGVIIRSGDSVIDASLRGRLRQLYNEFAN